MMVTFFQYLLTFHIPLLRILSPIWKVFYLVKIRVDITSAAVASILLEQEAWEADIAASSSAGNLIRGSVRLAALKT